MAQMRILQCEEVQKSCWIRAYCLLLPPPVLPIDKNIDKQVEYIGWLVGLTAVPKDVKVRDESHELIVPNCIIHLR